MAKFEMDTSALLDQILQAGRDLFSQGKDIAEQRLDIPEKGPQRDAALSAMGKGALAAGALALLLGTGTGRRLTGSILKLGSLAALGGVAYKTYQTWQVDQTGESGAHPGTPVNRLSGVAAEQRSLALLRAMLAAAKADGHIDEAEQQRIHDGIRRLGMDGTLVELLDAELSAPVDPAAVARGADSAEAAAEIYLASLIVIDADHPAERHYLDDLARHLKLDAGLVSELEAQARPG